MRMPTPDLHNKRHSASVLTIDLGAVQANYRQLASVAANAECAAVVKADGYGLGAVRVGQALASIGCRTFFTAHLDEAIALRAALPDREIYSFNGLMPGEAETFSEFQISPVLNSLGEIEIWARYCADAETPPPAALHLDTGMSRLGLMPVEVQRLAAEPERLGGFSISTIMSHLACSDMPGHPLNAQQRDAFSALTIALPRAPSPCPALNCHLPPPAASFSGPPGISIWSVPAPDSTVFLQTGKTQTHCSKSLIYKEKSCPSVTLTPLRPLAMVPPAGSRNRRESQP